MKSQQSLSKTNQNKRYISSRIRKEVWFRDKGQCTYVDPESGRQCTSRHRIQIDHIRPLAFGGSNELSNLRLLCQSYSLRSQYMLW